MSKIEIGAKWRRKMGLDVAKITMYNMSENSITLKHTTLEIEYVYCLDKFPDYWEPVEEPAPFSPRGVEKSLSAIEAQLVRHNNLIANTRADVAAIEEDNVFIRDASEIAQGRIQALEEAVAALSERDTMNTPLVPNPTKTSPIYDNVFTEEQRRLLREQIEEFTKKEGHNL